MAAVGNLFVRMGLKANEFYSGMNKVQKHTVKTGDSLRTIKRIAVAAFAGWGIKRLSSSFLEAAVTAEGYQVRLVGLLGSVEEGNKLFDEMNKYAAQTPFEFEKIMGAATALSGVMKHGAEEVSVWMPMIGDLAAATGLGIEQTTQQVIRMYSAGAASADLFRERGVLAMMGFQAGVSYTAEETRKMMIEAWADPASKFQGMTDELKKTWAGTMSMFSDMWFKFRNMVMDNDAFNSLKSSAQDLLATLQRLEQDGTLEMWAKAIGEAMSTAIQWGKDAVVFWSDFFGIAPAARLKQVNEELDRLSSVLAGTASYWEEGKVYAKYVTLENIASAYVELLGEQQEIEEFMSNKRLENLNKDSQKSAENAATKIQQFYETQEAQTEALTVMGETSQDFHNEEMERIIALQMFESGILGKRAKKFKWFTDFQASYEKAKGKERLKTNQEYFKLIAEALGKHGQAAFRAYQALAITETIMSTIQAAQNAYAWGWQYGGPLAPVLSVAMAAIAVAAGMARVSQIASEKFEYAMGGWVGGGSGVRDDVLIGTAGGAAHMATGGEFVVNKESAADNAELLEAINAGGTFGGVVIPVTIELDGEVLWSRTYKASRDGDLQIHEGALVSR